MTKITLNHVAKLKVTDIRKSKQMHCTDSITQLQYQNTAVTCHTTSY